MTNVTYVEQCHTEMQYSTVIYVLIVNNFSKWQAYWY